MAVLHLVRHGQALAGWGTDVDPGLSVIGVAQAEAVAGHLGAALAPRPIVVSPLRRTRETAAPLAIRWGRAPIVEPAVREIPSPTPDLAERARWLDGALRGRWPTLDEEAQAWRADLLAWVRSQREDAVVVTHFVAINAIVGAAAGSDAVTTFLPGNASVTQVAVDVATGGIEVVELGEQGAAGVG